MIEERPLPWQELVETLFRRRMMIFGGAAVGALIALVAMAAIPPKYRTKARLLLTAQAVAGPREAAMPQRQIEAELAMLQSPQLIRTVLEEYRQTGNDSKPQQAPMEKLKDSVVGGLRGLYSKLFSTPDPDSAEDDRRAVSLSGEIDVRPVSRTNIVEVQFTGSDPRWGAQFVNDLVDQHIQRIATSNEQANAGTFYQQQRNLLATRWEEAREALADFREEHGTSFLEGDEEHLRRVLSALTSEHVEAETSVLQFEAQVGSLAAALEQQPLTVAAEQRVTESTAMTLLNQRILELELRRSELISRYNANSSVVRGIDRQIEEARRLRDAKADETLNETMTAMNPARQALDVELIQVRSQLDAARARVNALSAQINEYRYKVRRLEDAGAVLEQLKNDVETAKEAYQNTLRLEEEARLERSLEESGNVNVSVFEAAEAPIEPVPVNKKVLLIVGLIAGLGAGLSFAYLRDWLDPSIKSSAQAFRLSGVPVVAEIP